MLNNPRLAFLESLGEWEGPPELGPEKMASSSPTRRGWGGWGAPALSLRRLHRPCKPIDRLNLPASMSGGSFWLPWIPHVTARVERPLPWSDALAPSTVAVWGFLFCFWLQEKDACTKPLYIRPPPIYNSPPHDRKAIWSPSHL